MSVRILLRVIIQERIEATVNKLVALTKPRQFAVALIVAAHRLDRTLDRAYDPYIRRGRI